MKADEKQKYWKQLIKRQILMEERSMACGAKRARRVKRPFSM